MSSPRPSPRLSESSLLAFIVPLVFISGACALIDQLVWTRELRLVFGASTAASSAVVAMFVAGLGAGGLWFGRRLEDHARPLWVYAGLELAVGAWAALTPWALELVRALYVWSGGSLRLGIAGSNVLRLALSALVLVPPTFAMGGTLPALARALEREADRSRRTVAVLYAINTLGAVSGAALATFVLLEALGSRKSLYLACALNAAIGVLAYVSARGQPPMAAQVVTSPEHPREAEPAAPRWFVYSSCAWVGFAFFLMELVWYRVLGPLLGGSVFTFGLILCVVLLGIGVGGALYAVGSSARPRLVVGFALSCALEALCIAVPYALGDRLAVGALFLQPFAAFGFGGLVLGWAAIAVCAVFPAAVVAGWQFPHLIALLGTGRTHVARDVGYAYAANTLGAIAGALAGGFGLIALARALGCWRAVCILLAAWSVCSLLIAWRGAARASGRPWLKTLVVIGLAAGSGGLLSAQGPTAAFRHSPIGVGRVPLAQVNTRNAITGFLMQERRAIDWQTDGVESTVAITHDDGLAFIVNGKSDGSALADAATQVMSGLLGAALAPRVSRALVVGLGTGSTAGWLASLPAIERVDVIEIEPAILEVARRCALVNRDALHNPKLHILRGDARELLATMRAAGTTYDVIFSEPSNPYRSGVASMYAREFYDAVHDRLTPDGIFVQWLQAYDVDARSVRTIYATLASRFPSVQTWFGMPEDLLLVASNKRIVLDLASLRERLAREPFASALRLTWYADSLEGFLAHFIAAEAFTEALTLGEPQLNTDDLSPVEFGFARSARGGAGFSSASILAAVRGSAAEHPTVTGGEVAWDLVDFERAVFQVAVGSATLTEILTPYYRRRLGIVTKWMTGDFGSATSLWNLLRLQSSDAGPVTVIERLARAELLAYEGSIESERTIDQLLEDAPTTAKLLHAVYALRHGQRRAGTERLRDALARYRSDPWPHATPFRRALNDLQIAEPGDMELAHIWLELLAKPFALHVNDAARESSRLRLVNALGPSDPACVNVFEAFEPYPPWSEEMLKLRYACYREHAHERASRAERDLAQFRADAPIDLARLLEL